MRISEWSSDVCSSDLLTTDGISVCNDSAERLAQRPVQTLAEHMGIGALLFAAPLGIAGCPRGYRGRLASIADKGPLRIEYGKAGKDIPFLWPAPHARMLVQERESFRHRLQYRDRKSTRLNPVTNAHLVCRLLLEKK